MSTFQRTETRCDFCGYGGAYSEPQDFVRSGESWEAIDLCIWCARPTADAGSVVSCGSHEATIGDDEKSWSCSCGVEFRDTGTVAVEGWPFFVPSRIRRGVPNLVAATVVHHVQN